MDLISLNIADIVPTEGQESLKDSAIKSEARLRERLAAEEVRRRAEAPQLALEKAKGILGMFLLAIVLTVIALFLMGPMGIPVVLLMWFTFFRRLGEQ
jgi:hypothetical protein